MADSSVHKNSKKTESAEPSESTINQTWPLRAASPGPVLARSKPLRKPAPLTIGVPVADAAPLPSPSRARWEHLRQHVLPIPSRPATPPAVQPPHAQPQLLPPPRAPTPKPSRLARLGFRHVVEQAREVAFDDTRKFSQELQRICWSIRFAEPQRIKADREPATMGSALHLPFMSSSSITVTGSSSVDNLSLVGGKKHELRRPQSSQTLRVAYRSMPSLKALYQTLVEYSGHATNGTPSSSHLPNELLVLSTLLRPFMTSERDSLIEDERTIALDSLDIIVRTWAPVDQVSGVERCLWYCKAAIPPSFHRMRINAALWGLMMPKETNYLITTLEAFQTLAQGFFSLLPSLHPLSTSTPDQEDVLVLNDLIHALRAGSCGEFDADSVQEEYNAVISDKDDPNIIRGAVLLEALSRCLENCTDDTGLWLFQNSLEEHWITYPRGSHYTQLLGAIHARVLVSISRALLNILSIPVDQSLYLLRAQRIVQVTQERLIPEIEAIEDALLEVKASVVQIVLELVCMDKARGPTRWGLSLFCEWYKSPSPWKQGIEIAFKKLISKRDWPSILGKLAPLLGLLPEVVRKPFVSFILPLVHDKLVEEPPLHPYHPLTSFFDTVAQLYPQIFYKVLFSCAASSKEFIVVNHLCIIVAVSKFLPNFWIRDAEMISVALMSDVSGKKNQQTADGAPWTNARLGQSILLLELIHHFQATRREKEGLPNLEVEGLMETVTFATLLESRLGVLIDAKELKYPIPPSQRLLFCVLFRELRLLTRSLKTALWLPRVISWFIDFHIDDGMDQDPEVEERSSVGQLQGLYAAAQDGMQSSHQRRSTMLLSKTLEKSHTAEDTSLENRADISAMFISRTTLVMSLSKGFISKARKLLVAVSTLLTTADYRRLGPHLWNELFSDGDSSLTAATSFLIMQCAEKTPLDLLAIVEIDLQSSDNDRKLQAIQKIGILSSWRFQILSQHVVADRARRPFKLSRGPLPFVATDMGSSNYIREDDPNELKDNIPSELRKRLAEIGWDQDDKPVDQHLEWLKTPMSLLPTYQLDRLDNVSPDTQMSLPSPPNPHAAEKLEGFGLLRRNSSSGGPIHGVKRRAVFVPSLALVFPRLASMVYDANFEVASAARELIIDLMRNDPALLARPILDLFAGETKDTRSAISTISAFLHAQRTLPSTMTHYLFNNLAGFLKFTSRNDEDGDALHDFAMTITVLSKLVNQVSGMSIREIRRAKLDPFLIPTGSLWFPSSAPSGPMFPRILETSGNPFDALPSHLVSITMIRVAQNLLFLSMLKRNRQDVLLVRKSMSRLVLPTLTSDRDETALELSDFIPQRLHVVDKNPNVTALSLMLSRSHILLVAQVFRSMSRHLNDRNELAILVDGLNQILIAHGDDIGVVAQAMIAFMVASTRFRRLFTSGGYALLMPAVIKVYAESGSHKGIKLAIEYAVNRFYALHREAFVFQTLDIMAHIAVLPAVDADWLAKSIFDLFSTLRKGSLPSAPDAAGIHNANKLEEREALIVSTAEEKPQTFLSLLRRGESKNKDQVTLDLPDEYETGRFGIDDFVRLFLTVIAHDPLIIRAEQFLRLLRFLTPYLYNASNSARAVLQEGVDALGVIFLRTSSKPRGSDVPTAQSINESNGVGPTEALLENQLLEKSRLPSDITAMRLDYLTLVVSFTRVGGALSQPAVFRMMGLIGILLKDAAPDVTNSISGFFTDFVHAALVTQGAQSVKTGIALLQDLALVINAHATTIDFTGVFETVTALSANPLYANDPTFTQVVISQICSPGLIACELAASENLVQALPFRNSLVALLSQAVLLRGADVIAELEKRTVSYDFLAGVVLPFAVSIQTRQGLSLNNIHTDSWRRDALARTWIRLLSYIMSICLRITERPVGRPKNTDKSRSTGSKRSDLPTFVVALQILKAVVIRAEDDLTTYLPGVWARLGAFLKTVLAEGSATFTTRSQDSSPLPSPTPSPRASGQFDRLQPSLSISTDLRGASLQGLSFSSPRIVDYSLWSILELLCIYRTPLFLQMRLFTVEKLMELDQELRYQNTHSPMVSSSRPMSSSMFSKPRRRSGLPSPSSSPQLHPSPSFPYDPSSPSLNSRQAGYNILASPHATHGGPKIVHLGPVSATSMFGRHLSLGRGKGTNISASSAKIKSLALVKATYRRIRTVQHCMGYELLLPMPHSHEIDADIDFTTSWTAKQALNAITQETDDLMEELEEFDRAPEDEVVLVDSFQPMLP